MVFRDIHCNPEIQEKQNILLPSLMHYNIYIIKELIAKKKLL